MTTVMSRWRSVAWRASATASRPTASSERRYDLGTEGGSGRSCTPEFGGRLLGIGVEPGAMDVPGARDVPPLVGGCGRVEVALPRSGTELSSRCNRFRARLASSARTLIHLLQPHRNIWPRVT